MKGHQRSSSLFGVPKRPEHRTSYDVTLLRDPNVSTSLIFSSHFPNWHYMSIVVRVVQVLLSHPSRTAGPWGECPCLSWESRRRRDEWYSSSLVPRGECEVVGDKRVFVVKCLISCDTFLYSNEEKDVLVRLWTFSVWWKSFWVHIWLRPFVSLENDSLTTKVSCILHHRNTCLWL